jgi:hypothetical protein
LLSKLPRSEKDGDEIDINELMQLAAGEDFEDILAMLGGSDDYPTLDETTLLNLQHLVEPESS